jgi:hypothetical protein
MQIPASLMMAAAVTLAQGSAAPPPHPLQLPPAGSIALSYTLTLLAIPFGHIDYEARFEGARYKAEIHFRTSGLAALLWKARIDATAEGRATPEALFPESYTSRSLTQAGAQRSVRVNYSAKGAPSMTADPPYDLSLYPVTNAQKQGTVDPVTAISSVIAGLSASAREPCGKTLAVFDGRRRYDIAFSFIREEQDSEGAGAHPRVCKAEYRHIAGLKQDVVDVSAVPAMYATFVDASGETRSYTFARTIWSSFLWGAVNAKLSEAKLDGKSVPFAQ